MFPEEEGESTPANPCGLVAKSFFNDTFKLYNESGREVLLNEKGIAWDSDIEIFKNLQ